MSYWFYIQYLSGQVVASTAVAARDSESALRDLNRRVTVDRVISIERGGLANHRALRHPSAPRA